MAPDIKTKRSPHRWIPRPIQLILRALGIMPTPLSYFVIDDMLHRNQELSRYRVTLERYFQTTPYSEGHLQEWHVRLLEVYKQKQSVEHELIVAHLARTRSSEETKPNPVEYYICIERTSGEPRPKVPGHVLENKVRSILGGERGKRVPESTPNGNADYLLFPVPPNREFEDSPEFDEALDAPPLFPGPQGGTTSATTVASASSAATMAASAVSTSGAMAASAISSARLLDASKDTGFITPAQDTIEVLSGPPSFSSSHKVVCKINFGEPPQLPKITHDTDVTTSLPAVRDYLYFYELVALAATIHHQKACYQLFRANCFWLAAMLVHVIRVYLEIDISVLDQSKFTPISGRDDPGDSKVAVMVSPDMGRCKNIQIVNTPKNSTLRKVLGKFAPHKEIFEQLLVRKLTDAIQIERNGLEMAVAKEEVRAEKEKRGVAEEKARTEAEKRGAAEEKARAEEGKRRAEEEKRAVAEEKARAEEEKRRVVEEKLQQMEKELERMKLGSSERGHISTA